MPFTCPSCGNTRNFLVKTLQMHVVRLDDARVEVNEEGRPAVIEVLMKPLENIRVLTLAVNLPGPLAAARLHQLGAAVVKVEPPGGDALAQASPDWYRELHEGQEIVRLNLKDAEDRARLDTWLGRADLLLTATRPAALRRLGLAWAELHARYPRLCQVALVGYGNLGSALFHYRGFARQGFRIAAIFDDDPAKVARSVDGVPIFAMRDLPAEAKTRNLQIASG